VVPALRVVPPYFDHPGFIDAQAALARDAGVTPDRFDHLVLSFHGLPRRYVDAGDVYASHCAVSAQLIAEKCGWPASRVTLAYQSKFGKEPWIGPATDATMHELAKSRARVAVMCPGFTADCLETLEEIAITGRERFMEAGGTDLCVVPALNLHPVWLDALAAIARTELGGWI
jgi:ferrochelatase